MATIKIKKPGKRELMPHQLGYVKWSLKNNVKDGACFMEMRLGKTLSVIREVAALGCKRVNIVLAPKQVLDSWRKELELEEEEYYYCINLSDDKKRELFKEAFSLKRRVWILINYEAVRVSYWIADLKYFAVILDESTVIKNPESQISQICVFGFRDAKYRRILSGLPSPESDLDLFQQFRFLDGHMMGYTNFYAFRNAMFMAGGWSGRTWSITPVGKKAIKDYVHNKAYIMRRQDAGMPNNKVTEVRKVEMLPAQKKAYIKAEKEYIAWIEDETSITRKETSHAIVSSTWCSRIAGGCDVEGNHKWDPKIKELLYLLKGDLKGQPVVIWFRFTAEILAVEAALKDKGIAVRTAYGANGTNINDENKRWFQNSKEASRVLLCQVKLVKFGNDFSAADTCIYYSTTDSCEENSQSRERIYHPKKKTPLLYIYLVTEDTIDEDRMHAINSKVTNAKMFMIKMNESLFKRKK